MSEHGGGIHALLVDDETALLEQEKIFLNKKIDNFSVETTTSPRKALDLLDKESFDAVVSDYEMPEMDGLDFLKTVREDRQDDIPFIIFTGKGREEVAMEALNLGADRYLQKGGSPKSQYGVLAQAIVQEVKHAKLEMEKKKVEAQLSSLVKGTDDLIFVVDENCRYTFANEATLKSEDVKRGDLIGSRFSDFHPEEDSKT
ncbi:MAG: response regulator, partial [Candidatus Aenigmatarchaeota archaeon]